MLRPRINTSIHASTLRPLCEYNVLSSFRGNKSLFWNKLSDFFHMYSILYLPFSVKS